MTKRFVAIWFRHLLTDWFAIRRPELRDIPFVLAAPDHGRMVVTAANAIAQIKGIHSGMTVADARTIIPSLQVLDDAPGRALKLLKGLAEWCIRYTPLVYIDEPDGLIFDASGCAHLWGGEETYLTVINTRLKHFGYTAHLSMADTIGSAWAFSRHGQSMCIIEPGKQAEAVMHLEPSLLRLDAGTAERLLKLGLRQIRNIIGIPRQSLKRRFGAHFLTRLDQALGYTDEILQPIQPVEPFHERLPCLEPIVTATGIEIALQRLLDAICHRLQQHEQGLRSALFKCYRVDGKIEQVSIGTNRASHNNLHLFKLFEPRLQEIEPALGIELFTLEAKQVEALSPLQQKLWEATSGLDNIHLSELLDRLAGRIGASNIHRYVPAEHYWPERSTQPAASLSEKITTGWRTDKPRPMQLLSKPEPVEVMAPVPDYPPMLFRYKGKLHTIVKADGPERIEQEWWIQQGQHRDYYYVEDEEGCRYWLFRSGHYDADRSYRWFIHGFFA
ncbi:MAG TPA: DNA polymerase Y family protein [Chitinophagaceae bacterium]|nr:DNA polymerase Y family protein [Chitinophagaceae bacterium]